MSDAPESILIVDDEQSITDFVSYSLKKEGFSVDTAANGEEGLAAAMRKDYDLFILDIMLPGMDGYELCRRLRARTASPVLFLSARDTELDKVVGEGGAWKSAATTTWRNPSAYASSSRASARCCVAAAWRIPRPTSPSPRAA